MVSRGLALVSGSGGVGRTTLAVNLAHIYARTGQKVLLADLCFGWGGLNQFASNLPTLDEILDSEGLPADTVSNSEYGFDLLTSIPPDFLELENDDIKKLAWVLNRICANYDLVIYDMPSGGHPLTLLAAGMSDKVFLVARPDATSFGSAYCLLKALHLVGINTRVRVVFSMVESEDQAASLKTRFDLVSGRYLGYKAASAGFVLRSPELFENDFHSCEIKKSSQSLLRNLELPGLAMFQDGTFLNSNLNAFPGPINQRR